MSMNVHIVGEREIFIPSVNQKDVQRIRFDCIQTPTKDSYEIERSENPIQAYREWVLNRFEDEVENVYADDDILCEGEPIGTEITNYGKCHVQELEKWISSVEADGYVVGHKYGMRRVCMIRPPNPEEVIFMDGNYTSTFDIHTNYELVGKVSSIDATVNLV